MRFSKQFNVVGVHAEGEVGNVVVGGIGDVPGKTMFEKKLYLEQHRDDVRQMLLHEPRGSAVRNANIVLPATDPQAQMGYVIAEPGEYPAMSGSNTICVATVLLETGMLPMTEPVTELTLESPAGLITVRCTVSGGKVTEVEFRNQPAFVHQLDATVDVPGLGEITIDVAWGGMTFALVDADSVGLAITPANARELCVLGERIKKAAAGQLETVHPLFPEYPGVTVTEFTGPPREEDGVLRARNTVVVSPGRCDRSPCGTGSSARLAVLHARGLIQPGQTLIHESIIGSKFTCRIDSTTTVGDRAAVVPVIAGQAWITDISVLGLDPTDPYPSGYKISDSWLGAG
ncbi:MAG TPA: proline racemase family protein [Amycolatopsis sp.]|uniref:proline racemase family protein n=1 Tax=Amycolatopsis sp. TaxID=37632 RepID=UPI002B482C6E|nr:proline racemase family protein [Amycolatopsis sp.]HKS45027.1 proline racemase family protein [Amycolatopsis sp.]